MGPTQILIPSSVSHDGTATRYEYSEIIIEGTVGLQISVVKVSATAKTYAHTGEAGSLVGPSHTATYHFPPNAKDYLGNPLESRSFVSSACLTDRSNYFAGHRRTYDVTVEGSFSVCLIMFCFDIINGFIHPWNAK